MFLLAMDVSVFNMTKILFCLGFLISLVFAVNIYTKNTVALTGVTAEDFTKVLFP